jgi:hypothetical protein
LLILIVGGIDRTAWGESCCGGVSLSIWNNDSSFRKSHAFQHQGQQVMTVSLF